MSPEEFAALARQGYNRIPLVREILADLETPLSTYLKVARGAYSYMLESVQGGEKWGRYSIIGLPCRTVLRMVGDTLTVEKDGEVVQTCRTDDPFAFIESFQERFRVPAFEDLPRFNGGLVGYFGYDSVRYVEHRVAESVPPDDVGTPDILLMLSEELIIFDNLRGKLSILVHVDPQEEGAYERGQQRLQSLSEQLARPVASVPDAAGASLEEADFVSSFGQQAYEAAVYRIREYILAGDVMQVVLSQRMSVPFEGQPINLYRALRQLNPSPYMVFMDLAGFNIVSASPEILARVEDGKITVRPLAGTRRRGRTEEEDVALEKELLADAKEIAEHLMLIDLSRNDSGRVSRIGSVKVSKQMAVERYSHVMHMASTVESMIADDKTSLDVLKATLPVGTLSGAPKIRAMEIIDELEPVKRGIYGGAMGYLSWHGNMDMAITIRTAVIKDGRLHIQAGAGVVADSQPRLEWKETMNKARAMFHAVKRAQEGLS